MTMFSSLTPCRSAITLYDVAVKKSTFTCAVVADASASPSGNDTATTGIVAWNPSVGRKSSAVRAGVLPWLKMITALAPAAWAFVTFTPKVHVPRWRSAMLPATGESSAKCGRPSQPLVTGSRGGAEVDVDGR